MNIRAAIAAAVAGHDIGYDDMLAVMREIMTGEATAAQIAGFLVALRLKGESVEEVTAAAAVMRELARHVDVDVAPLIDTAGTGGDSASTFNISTAAAFVIAAAGGYVAKHGNRAVSSSSGSADVLEAAGAKLDLEPAEINECIEATGVGFMFAPAHHGATRHAMGPRRELGVRTLFNVLGPLTNPAGAPYQLMGIFDESWLATSAEVLKRLGANRAFVVHGTDGLDEISIAAPTRVAELHDGEITYFDIAPGDFGVDEQPLAPLQVSDARQSLAVIYAVFANKPGPARDIVSLNAGAGIYVCGLVDSLTAGVAKARELIAAGAAAERLQRFVEFTRKVKDRS